jgi:uncharacterized protein (TIGR02145 family)
VKSGNSEFVLKGNSIGGSALSSQSFSSKPLAKQAKAAVAMNDVIAATKTGYLNYRCVQYNSDTTGIAIKMIASAGPVTDTDGNVYQTVQIGTQVWTVENLRVTKYNDGSAIQLDTAFVNLNPKYCFYKNTTNPDSIKKYGALYNWPVVDPTNPKKIAPTGWHVPSDSEWIIMEKYLVLQGLNWDGTTDTSKYNKIAKPLAAKTDWFAYSISGTIGCNLTINNGTGFSALPGGYRLAGDVDFIKQHNAGRWWSSSETSVFDTPVAWFRELTNDWDALYRGETYEASVFSIRLVRNN